MIRYMRAWLRVKMASPAHERAMVDAEVLETFLLLPPPEVAFEVWASMLTVPIKAEEERAAREQKFAVDGLLSDPALSGVIQDAPAKV